MKVTWYMAGGALHSDFSSALELKNSTFVVELQQQVEQSDVVLVLGHSGTVEFNKKTLRYCIIVIAIII